MVALHVMPRYMNFGVQAPEIHAPQNKTKVASGVGCSERSVLYFRELLFKSNKKKFSFRRVESEKIGSHPRRDLL